MPTKKSTTRTAEDLRAEAEAELHAERHDGPGSFGGPAVMQLAANYGKPKTRRTRLLDQLARINSALGDIRRQCRSIERETSSIARTSRSGR